jgi:outer membrane protein TolC
LAKNNQLPILDAYATPGEDVGGFAIGDSLKAGVQLVIPLRQRTAKGQYQQAVYKIDKLNITERQQLQKILLEVDDAYSELKAQYQQYLAAKKAEEMAFKLQEGELMKFDMGDSTLFLLNQRERAFLEASLAVIDIQQKYLQAISQLQLAINSF